MIPKLITQQLSALRRRERFLETVWGLARILALAVTMVLLACLIDFVVDRFAATPMFLRLAMWIVMIGTMIVAGIVFFQPLASRLDDDELTLWVEDKTPVLGHRLITAVQLNREDAHLAGMSKELVGVVTAEAEQQARRVPFKRMADHTRLKRSALVVGPALLVGLGALFAFSPLSYVLLGRLFFSGAEIERRVTIENLTDKVWPVGDPITITVKAKGLRPGEEGFLRIRQGLAFTRFDLHREEELGVSRNASDEAIFTAKIPDDRFHSGFEFNAFIGDGRLKDWGSIQFKQRPVVKGDPRAWRILPSYCGTWGPYNDKRFEQEQPHGDVKSIRDSGVRVRITMATPATKVRVELLGPEKIKGASTTAAPDAEPDHELTPSLLVVKRFMDMKKIDSNEEEGQQWETTFDMQPTETAYQIVAVDEQLQHSPDKRPPLRRKLEIEIEKAPVVFLLPERFPRKDGQTSGNSAGSDFMMEGLPLPVEGQIPVAYTCNHPYGLGRARLMYRVQKKRESGNDDPNTENFREYRLGEGNARSLDLTEQQLAGCGDFDPSRGCFFNRPEMEVPFFAVPARIPSDPSLLPQIGRTWGGGWFLFGTKGIAPDEKGTPRLTPQKGDVVAFYIEVSPERTPGKIPRPVGKSEIRYKTVVDPEDLDLFVRDLLNEEIAIRGLEKRQREVGEKIGGN